MSICGIDDCGVDTVATCARCGERRCSAHYIISMTASRDVWVAVTPNGPMYIKLPASWMSSAVSAYVEGGAACTRCRQQAAVGANARQADEAHSMVEEFIRAPSPQAIPRIMLREPELTDDQLKRMLAAARPHLQPNCEVLSLRWQTPASRRRKARIQVSVTSREPGVRVNQGPLLLASGELIQVDRGSRVGVSPSATEMSCVATFGAVPVAEYHPAYGSGEWGNDAGIYISASRPQDRVHAMQWPLARASADMEYIFGGIAAGWR